MVQLIAGILSVVLFWIYKQKYKKFLIFVKPEEVNTRYAICIEEQKAKKIARRPTAIAL